MRYLLSNRGRAALARSVRGRALLVLDYDGTLAPIVDDPARAILRARTRSLLARLTRRMPCAVLSGRAVRELAPFLAGIELVCQIGNHGAEWRWRADPAPAGTPERPLVRSWRRALARRLPAIDGIRVEPKGLSLTVHYRRARSPAEAERVILRAVAGLPRARVTRGACVVNVVPDTAPDKGDALMRLLERLDRQAAIFVGDDVTDEDAFRVGPPGVLTARVGRVAGSRAEFYLRDQREVDDLLAVLWSLAERDAEKLPVRA